MGRALIHPGCKQTLQNRRARKIPPPGWTTGIGPQSGSIPAYSGLNERGLGFFLELLRAYLVASYPQVFPRVFSERRKHGRHYLGSVHCAIWLSTSQINLDLSTRFLGRAIHDSGGRERNLRSLTLSRDRDATALGRPTSSAIDTI
jgi:hypothetical protein